MRANAFVSATVALLAAATAFGDVSPQLSAFATGPAQWIMTRDEQARWKTVTTDADAQAFIDLFWARRDPTPSTAANEFRETFDTRVKYADDHFAHGRTPGSMSDRGRVLIVMGAPTRVQRSGSNTKSTILTPDDALGKDTSAPSGVQGYSPKQMWVFEASKIKTPLNVAVAEIVFFDQYGDENWKLDRSPRTDVNGLLDFVNDRAVVQPSLTVAPKLAAAARPPAATPVVAAAPTVSAVPAVGAFKTEALKTAVDAMRASKQNGSGNLFVSYGEYVTPQGDYFIPVQLFVPKSAGMSATENLTLFGIVEDATGQPAAIFEEPVKLTASKDDFFADRSLTLAPGKYKGTFGLARDGKPVSTVTTEMNLVGMSKDAPGISQLILSNNVYPLESAQNATDPYSFGGIKVVPKSDRTFTNQDELWYFFELRNPAVDAATSAPKVRLKMLVDGKTVEGKPVKFNNPAMDVEAQPLKGVPGHFAVGQSIPLASFKPGDYTLRMTVTDVLGNKSYDLQEPFKVVK